MDLNDLKGMSVVMLVLILISAVVLLFTVIPIAMLA